MKNYIEFDDTNYLWNSGHLNVFVNGKQIESIFIDDFPDLDMDELFEQLAEKYNITEELVYKKVNYYTR
jgi:hypothetical protein